MCGGMKGGWGGVGVGMWYGWNFMCMWRAGVGVVCLSLKYTAK